MVILFLSASPAGLHPLKLGQELADIERERKMAPFRDSFRIESRWAVTVDELMRHLMEIEPDIIHFSGHGGSAGIIIQDEFGHPTSLPPRALALILRAAVPSARLVVLNACDSTIHAESLRAAADCIVLVGGEVGDDAARTFAVRFYGAIFHGRSIGNALLHGRAALAARQLLEELLPRCVTRKGVDAYSLVLGQSAPCGGPRG